MGKREVISLIFKVLGVYAVIQGLSGMAGLHMISLSQSGDCSSRTWALLGAVSPFLIPVVAGAWLWYASEWFAARLSEDTNHVQPPISLREVEIVAFSIAGLFILARVLPQTTNICVQYAFFAHRKPPVEGYTNLGIYSQVPAIALQCLLGLCLLLRPKWFFGLVYRVRSGLPDSESPNSNERPRQGLRP